ncbi:MAG: M56 family metallopeptidase [Hyphomicrobiales bacterium]
MTLLETVLSTYFDISVLLIATAGLWLGARFVMKQFSFRYAFTSQARLLKFIILAAITLPILFSVCINHAVLSESVPINLSDFVVSQYIKGNLQMSPLSLEAVLTARQTLTSEITSLDHPFTVSILVGMMLCGFYMGLRSILTAVKLRSSLQSAYPWRRFGNVQFAVSDTLRVPYSTRTFGQRYIVLPSSMLVQPTDLKVAIAHELQHLRQRDVEWEIGAALLTPVFFWNPAFYYLKHQIEELRELSCDQQVLRRANLTAREYCDCLLRVCANRFERPSIFALQIPKVSLVETQSRLLRKKPARLLANRVLSALDGNARQQSRVTVAIIAVLLLTLSGLMAFAIQKPNDWSHDRLMLSTIVNLDRLEQRNSVGLGTQF